jgi:glycosyltransferase involved in cell wall biosynthesis
MRIAFLTNEFVIETPDRGGLASYLNRVTKALAALGHEIEVFVTRRAAHIPDWMEYGGVGVHHVALPVNRVISGVRFADRLMLKSPWGGVSNYLATAAGLRAALEYRHRVKPFDAVQSTNCGATGLLIRPMRGRVHVTRLSSVRSLCFKTDGWGHLPGGRLMARLEWLAALRSDAIYAPSRFTADHFNRPGRRRVEVLRPPMYLETDENPRTPDSRDLGRYLLHFGSIGPVKGSGLARGGAAAGVGARAWFADDLGRSRATVRCDGWVSRALGRTVQQGRLARSSSEG